MSLNFTHLTTDHIITSVNSTKQKLTLLKEALKAQKKHHNKVIAEFISDFDLNDIQQIDSRYPHLRAELATLTEQANHYALIVKSRFDILDHGVDVMVNESLAKPIAESLSTLNRSTLLLAQTKLQAESNLSEFLRQNRTITKDSKEERTKNMLEMTLRQFEEGKKSLSEIERLAMECYEVILKTESHFEELMQLENVLSTLRQKLSSSKPISIDIEAVPVATSWDTLVGTTEISADSLAARLSERLSMKTPEPDDWDRSAPNSRPASLQGPLNRESIQAALLAHAQQVAAPQEPDAAFQGGVPRPNS
ncbi:MAG: hypothetical protein AB7I18_00040 [Candidatus Berkiella sp.]